MLRWRSELLKVEGQDLRHLPTSQHFSCVARLNFFLRAINSRIWGLQKICDTAPEQTDKQVPKPSPSLTRPQSVWQPEEPEWRNATVDLLCGTISVFDTDTQVCGQSRKQQMLQPQGSVQGLMGWILLLSPPRSTSNGWRRRRRHAARPHKLGGIKKDPVLIAVCTAESLILISLSLLHTPVWWVYSHMVIPSQ